MFGKNVGRTVQIIAKIMVWLWMVAGVVMGIVVNMSSFVMVERMSALEGLGRAITALLGVCLGGAMGFIVGWFSSVLLYAFGDLVSSTHVISEDLDYLCRVKEDDIARAELMQRKQMQYMPSVQRGTQPSDVVYPQGKPMAGSSMRMPDAMQLDAEKQYKRPEASQKSDPQAPPF